MTGAYKVLGQIDADSGVGVLGQNDAASGTPIGVQGAVPNASDGYGFYTDDDAFVGGGVTAFELNTDVLVPDATGPSVQSAIDDATAGAVVQTYGDLSLSSTLTVDKRVHWIHHGDMEVGADAGAGIRLGHAAQFQNFSIVILGNVFGQGATDGARGFDVRSANAGFIYVGRVAGIETGLRFEGTGARVGPLDNTVCSHKIETVTTGIELFANGHIVQEMVFRNVPIFDAEKAVHVHAASGATSDRSTLNYFDGVTVHGSTNPSRNTDEILEEGNHSVGDGGPKGGNVYNLKFLPGDSSLTSLYEPSRLLAPNRPELPPAGVAGETVYAFQEWFQTPQEAIDHAESHGYGRVVVPPGSYSPITISMPLAVTGLGVSTAGGSITAPIFDDETSNPGISVESNDVHLTNLQAQTEPTGFVGPDAIHVSSSSDAVRIVDCTVAGSDGNGLYVDGVRVIVRGVVIKGTIDLNDIVLGPNSQSCVVDGNIGSVTDNGAASNVVGDNAG